ncbi:hypothetical protein AB0L82_42640 [Nocardia sp. NPDC052001]|uniref:hypothetical protein n=1 Tax=Nocardia sp. NPDC052001 TaxID=3154853 RepID=UPI003424D5ED
MSVPVDEQYSVDMAICGHVLRHVYEDETSAELSIAVQHGQIQYTLVSSAQPINFPDDELVHAICDLVGLHERYSSGPSGAGLATAVYRYDKNPDGGWSASASYSYE